MDDGVVLNRSEVDVKFPMSRNRLHKSRKQNTNSPNWSQVCFDLSSTGIGPNFKVLVHIWRLLIALRNSEFHWGLALILLVLFAVAIGTMRHWKRHCAMCVGITVNSISLLVFFIATTFASLNLGFKFSRVDIVKDLKFVVHSAILLLQVSTLIVEFTDLVGSGKQDCTIFFTFVECLVIFGNICTSEKEYAKANQQRLLANRRNRRKPKRGGGRKYFYKRLHHYSIY